MSDTKQSSLPTAAFNMPEIYDSTEQIWRIEADNRRADHEIYALNGTWKFITVLTAVRQWIVFSPTVRFLNTQPTAYVLHAFRECLWRHSTLAHQKEGRFLSDLVNFVPVDKFIEPYLGFKEVCTHCVEKSYVGNFTIFNRGRSKIQRSVASPTYPLLF